MKVMRNVLVQLIAVSVLSLAFVLPAFADYAGSIKADQEAVKEAIKRKSYSPYAARSTPTMVLWGDTHLHTSLSLDARAFGATLGPEEAYRFARGDEVTSSHGERVKLSRPLDWLVISDHSDGMGTMSEILAGNSTLLQDPMVKGWYDKLQQGGDAALMAVMEIIESFAGGNIPPTLLDEDFIGSIWEDYLEIAERYNDPGRFTTIIGYEWTSTEGGNNLHRNVLYRDGADLARRMLPYTTTESFNPEDRGHGWLPMRRKQVGGCSPWPITVT